jgi:hypothetical protein
MRVTSEHAEFYRQRRAPMPKWASQFLPRARVSIDTCIAHHANAPRDTDALREIGNLLVIVRMIEKRLNRHAAPELRAAILSDELYRISREGHNNAKRQAYARKWAKRIVHERQRHDIR